MGPYQITSISSSDLYFVKDKYSHQLKRSIPPNHLVRYYGVGGFCQSDVKVENCQSDSSDMETGVAYQSDDESNVSQNSPFDACQRTGIHKIAENKNHDSDGISQSQITIMQRKDSPFSSDEPVLEVCSVNDNNDYDDDDYDDDDSNNPWGDMHI